VTNLDSKQVERRRTCRNYPSMPNQGKRPKPNESDPSALDIKRITHIDDDPEQEEEREEWS
jgi:hypothetical protein